MNARVSSQVGSRPAACTSDSVGDSVPVRQDGSPRGGPFDVQRGVEGVDGVLAVGA